MTGADLRDRSVSDDVACDIRDHYRELIEDGVEDVGAIQRTVEKFGAYLDEPDGIALIAFAVSNRSPVASLAVS